jgi:DNA-binding winged helix-turn-helix (wHTH) protein
MRLRFGEHVLDPDSRQLFRGREEVRLGPRVFDLLEQLVRSRPRALRKAEIQRRLWPDTAVGDGSLAFLVSELRARLGDDARRPRYIRTVPAFGYAFCGEVTEAAAAATLTASAGVPRVAWEDRVVPLAEGENLLGRDPDARVRIDVTGVSRRHARVVLRGGEATLEDLGSKNGTFVGRRDDRVTGPVPLPDGSPFRLGRVLLTYRCSPETTSTATAPGP